VAAPGEVLRPIIGLDVDGTFARYHEHFERFFREWSGKETPGTGYAGGQSFASYLGTSKATYRQAKLAYRLGGWKRSMPVYDGAADMVRAWRSLGAEVAICTTRPFLSLEAVEKDTHHFLRRNGIQHDYVIHGERKYLDLARFGTDRIAFVADDLPEMVRQADSAGLISVIRTQPYNADMDWNIDAYDIEQLMWVGCALIEEWKAKHA
jgi:hypothetical protein